MNLRQALPENLHACRAVNVLERAMEQNRLPHGILLHGESLDEVQTVARALASELLQTKRDPFNHPDCFILRPSGRARVIRIGSDSERVGGFWPNNTMRRLVADVQKSSNQGGRKVALLFEADRMNVQSANAFLKTLEEPPGDTTLILLTNRPYDLLDTIRSRCLNFRLPSGYSSIEDPAWLAWLEDYKSWLGRLLNRKPDKKDIPSIVLGGYGLNHRFQGILKNMTETAWVAEKNKLPEHITDEEKKAIEAGITRGFRKQLFAEIEKHTVLFARLIEATQPGGLPVTALARALEALEHSTGLLELNFNQAAALELFFLKSQRIWMTTTQ
ncbi:MAG: DNA polymerase III subunit gamma/tau [Opitutales bacterium]